MGRKNMNANRKSWNQGQQKLRLALTSVDHQKAIDLFLIQHAMVHSSKMSKSDQWSFEDEILNDMAEEEIRQIPRNSEHSVAWIIFHIARIEDITMNMLVAGTPQLFTEDNWAMKMKVAIVHSANKMDHASLATLSAQIDINALRAYRQSVGNRTRKIVRQLKLEELKQKVDALRLQKVLEEGALVPEAIEILNYWSKRTITGLLLMPPTRHNFLHLNEALRIKQH
jgi:hypothetical protein